jgi:ABC-2 type transport system permease protein
MSLKARVSLPPHPLAQALRAEWTKLRTVAGPAWLLAGAVALTVAVGAAAASAAQCQSATCGIDPAKVSFTGIYVGQAVAAVVGVLAIGDEYSTGLITLSLTAVLRRLTWFFAKAAVLTGPVLEAAARTGMFQPGQLLAGEDRDQLLRDARRLQPFHRVGQIVFGGQPFEELLQGTVLVAGVGVAVAARSHIFHCWMSWLSTCS